jgi:MFS family permease
MTPNPAVQETAVEAEGREVVTPAVEDEKKPGTLHRIFQAFTYRDFRLLWFGAFTSSSGTWLQETAQSWLLFQLTSQAFYLGLLSFLATAPILLFSLIGGVIADRFDRRRILLGSQYMQLIYAFTLASLVKFAVPNHWLVVSMLLLAFLTGCAQAFGGPAYQALVPALVERKDLANAIALNSIQFNLARVVGPAVGGLGLAYFGAAGCFTLNGFSFLAVIVALSMLRIQHLPRSKGTSRMRTELRSGLNFVWRHEALRSLTLLSFACTFLGTQVITFLPVFAREVFHTGSGGYGALLSLSGGGAVVGALGVAGLGDIKHKGRAALMTQLCFGAVIIGFTLTRTPLLAYPLIFLAGIFMMSTFAYITSLVQLLLTDEMRGRVMSIYMVAFRGGMPLGALMTGLLAKQFQLSTILTCEGILLVLIAGSFLASSTKVKEH